MPILNDIVLYSKKFNLFFTNNSSVKHSLSHVSSKHTFGKTATKTKHLICPNRMFHCWSNFVSTYVHVFAKSSVKLQCSTLCRKSKENNFWFGLFGDLKNGGFKKSGVHSKYRDLIWNAIYSQAVDRIGDFEAGKAEDVNTFPPTKSKKVTIKEPLKWDEYY